MFCCRTFLQTVLWEGWDRLIRKMDRQLLKLHYFLLKKAFEPNLSSPATTAVPTTNPNFDTGLDSLFAVGTHYVVTVLLPVKKNNLTLEALLLPSAVGLGSLKEFGWPLA